MEQVYTVKNWHTKDGKDPIGKEYKNKWLYATLKGPDLHDCDIQSVTVNFPKVRSEFEGEAEFRMKYGGYTASRKIQSTNGKSVKKNYVVYDWDNRMFSAGGLDVVFYVYVPLDDGYFAIEDGNVTVTVVYDLTKSVIQTHDTEAIAGGTYNFRLRGWSSGYTHKATLTVGEKSAMVELDAGVNDGSIDIPFEWLSEITGSTSRGDGKLVLETFSQYGDLGSDTVEGITFKVADDGELREAVLPTFSAYAVENVYTIGDKTFPDIGAGLVSGKSGIRATVVDVAGMYGATVTTQIKMGDQVATSTGDLQLGPVIANDTYTSVDLIITDSRGLTTTKSIPITVKPYKAPDASIDAWRVDDDGDRNDFGTNGAYQYAATHSDLDGKNPATIKLAVGGISQTNPPESGTLLPSEFVYLAQDKAYDVTLTVADAYETVERKVRIPSAAFLFHGRGDGKGAGIGQAAEHINALVINPNWAVYMGGQEIVALINQLVDDVAALKAQN